MIKKEQPLLDSAIHQGFYVGERHEITGFISFLILHGLNIENYNAHGGGEPDVTYSLDMMLNITKDNLPWVYISDEKNYYLVDKFNQLMVE
jgi:hypothetical protein